MAWCEALWEDLSLYTSNPKAQVLGAGGCAMCNVQCAMCDLQGVNVVGVAAAALLLAWWSIWLRLNVRYG